MIKALRRRFIFTAMTAISALIVVLLGVINTVNVWSSEADSARLLSMLLSFESSAAPQMQPREQARPALFSPHPSENDRLSAVFFSARFDNGGALSSVDVSRIASLTEDEAAALAERAAASGLSGGRLDGFRYACANAADESGRVYVFMDVSSSRRGVLKVAVLSALAGLLCWGAMLLLVFLLSGRAIAPVAENMARQRQFVTDAGHELKTPLAIILANTDALELHGGESKWSANIRQQTMRLSGLMQNLLALARADESGSPYMPTSFSLSELLAESAEMFDEPASQKGCRLVRDIAADVSLSANREQIAQLVSILLDNAVSYSSGGDIRVALSREGKRALLSVENRCEALPPVAPEKLFDRFYRADGARTQKNGGCGIGLSAARAIAALHGGTLSAEYTGENTIRFTARL